MPRAPPGRPSRPTTARAVLAQNWIADLEPEAVGTAETRTTKGRALSRAFHPLLRDPAARMESKGVGVREEEYPSRQLVHPFSSPTEPAQRSAPRFPRGNRKEQLSFGMTTATARFGARTGPTNKAIRWTRDRDGKLWASFPTSITSRFRYDPPPPPLRRHYYGSGRPDPLSGPFTLRPDAAAADSRPKEPGAPGRCNGGPSAAEFSDADPSRSSGRHWSLHKYERRIAHRLQPRRELAGVAADARDRRACWW